MGTWHTEDWMKAFKTLFSMVWTVFGGKVKEEVEEKVEEVKDKF